MEGDTDREARLEVIAQEWSDINEVGTAAHDNSLETVMDVRWLLSEIGRLENELEVVDG